MLFCGNLALILCLLPCNTQTPPLTCEDGNADIKDLQIKEEDCSTDCWNWLSAWKGTQATLLMFYSISVAGALKQQNTRIAVERYSWAIWFSTVLHWQNSCPPLKMTRKEAQHPPPPPNQITVIITIVPLLLNWQLLSLEWMFKTTGKIIKFPMGNIPTSHTVHFWNWVHNLGDSRIDAYLRNSYLSS